MEMLLKALAILVAAVLAVLLGQRGVKRREEYHDVGHDPDVWRPDDW